MRILTISNVPLEARLGSGYVILGYAHSLRLLGHHVDVFGPETFERFKFFRRGKLLRIALGMLWHVMRHAAKGQYDVVELYGGQTCLAANYLSRLKRRKFLVVAHTNGIEMHMADIMAKHGILEPSGLPAWIKRRTDLPVAQAFTEVDGIVTVSAFDGDYARRKCLQPDERIVSLDNPLNDEFLFRSFPRARSPLIGFIAPWTERKGSELVAAALPGVLRQFREAKLRLIGPGRNFRKEDHFPTDVCNQIEVVNENMPRDRLIEQYEEIAIMIMPSIFESFGLVATEAMGCGCAIVAPATGFAYDLKEGEFMLMDRLDAESLAMPIIRLLSDEPLRQKVSENGWKRVQGLTWDRAVTKLAGTYSEWLGQIRGEALPSFSSKGSEC
jgi:glycosyltransferase involved in cell wall biosynthesis